MLTNVHVHAGSRGISAITNRAAPQGWTALLQLLCFQRGYRDAARRPVECPVPALHDPALQLDNACRLRISKAPLQEPSFAVHAGSQPDTDVQGLSCKSSCEAPPQFSSGSGSSGTSRTLIVWVLADRQMGCRPLCTIATCCPPSTKPRRFSSSTALPYTDVVTR